MKKHENWRGHRDFPDYWISDFGNVMRATVGQTRRLGHKPKGHLKNGYKRFKLMCAGGGKKDIGAHQLVAGAFLGPPPSPSHVVAHWDGDKLNNHVSNLRWATVAENAQDSARQGTFKGANNGRAKLTQEQVNQARARYSGKYGEQTSLAREYNMSASAMRSILIGENWNG